MPKTNSGSNQNEFTLDDVVSNQSGPIVVQLGKLAALPDHERNAAAWAILKKASSHGKLLSVTE